MEGKLVEKYTEFQKRLDEINGKFVQIKTCLHR